ncbi:MAG TPA: Hsp20/alpha crystallin family protein [Streptosporangiaceae bacterium]
MSTLTRKESRLFPDLFDWMESPMTMFRPLLGQGMRMEDYVRDGHYVVRAELPGVDPEKEIDVSISDGILSIRAERKEEEIDKSHSEFRYGVFTRQIVLPAGADEGHVEATYDKGILEVDVAMKSEEARKAEKRIPVTRPT